jgi:hypothetical protein
VTLYFRSDSCAAGSHSVSWCVTGSGSNYTLYRNPSSSCTGATQRFAQFLTSSSVFLYIPPNAHTTSLGSGVGGIVTQDGSYTLPRLHVELRINRSPSNANDMYHLIDDVALRNGPRTCGTGVASC